MHDGLVGGGVGGDILGGGEGAGDEGDLNRGRFVILDFDQGVDRVVVEQLDAEEGVDIREGCLEVGVEDGCVDWGGARLSIGLK